MNNQEKIDALQRLSEEQLMLQSVMTQSDAHASKCIKLGLNFKETYPEEYTSYEDARNRYNENEEKIKEINNTDTEEIEIETD